MYSYFTGPTWEHEVVENCAGKRHATARGAGQ